MLVNQRLAAVGVLMVLVAVMALVACGDAATPAPQMVEVTKEVPVEVTRVVTETVIETEEVPVEVTKVVTETVVETVVETVTETVVETEEVEVPVTQIVERTIVVEATPVPQAAKEQIVFSDLNWSSAQVQNRIVQFIVEKGMGYPTDVILGGTLPLFQGLRKGDTHVTMEIWLPNQSIGWSEAVELGEVVSVGKSIVGDWQSTFVIPAYVAEAYPDLKTPEDLAKPEFQELFATDESRGKARLVACVPGWSCELANDEQIETYGLTDSLYVVKPGSQEAMFAEVFGAYERQEPWLGYMWGSGDPGIKLDLVPLEEAPYTKECWDTDKACAFDESLVLVAIHPSLLPRAPDVIAFLQQWDFGLETYKEVFHWRDANEGSTPADGAIFWMNENADLWTSWLPADIAANVQAALDAGEKPEGWPDE